MRRSFLAFVFNRNTFVVSALLLGLRESTFLVRTKSYPLVARPTLAR